MFDVLLCVFELQNVIGSYILMKAVHFAQRKDYPHFESDSCHVQASEDTMGYRQVSYNILQSGSDSNLYPVI